MVERGPQREGTTQRDITAFGKVIDSKVQGMIRSADPTLTDGSPQTIGERTVKIYQTPAGENGEVRTTYIAEKAGVLDAQYSTIADAEGVTIGEITTLHGDVDGAHVTLMLTRVTGEADKLLVSVPNPHKVPPGRQHSMPIGEHDPEYINRVRRAFGIPQPKQRLRRRI